MRQARVLPAAFLALAVGCAPADQVIYEQGNKPPRGEFRGLHFPYLLVTRTDIERLHHLDAAQLVYDIRELCRIHDHLMDDSLAKEDPPKTRKEVIPIVPMPFKAQNIEALRWALILRGDPALEEVIRALREIDLKNVSLLRELAETLAKWRSEKAAAALVDFGAELAARADVEREPIHIVVAALFYWRFSKENLRAFVYGERVGKVRRIVLKLMEFEGVSGVHMRFFNRFFPEQAIDPADGEGSPPAPESR